MLSTQNFLLPSLVAIIPLLGAVELILMIVGGVKENNIRNKYWGVFGRPKAFFFAVGAFGFLPSLAFSPLVVMYQLNGGADNPLASRDTSTMVLLIGAGVAVLWLLLAVGIGISVKRKCPPQMRKGLFGSMFLAGMGFFGKALLVMCSFFLVFFIPGFWGGARGQFGDY